MTPFSFPLPELPAEDTGGGAEGTAILVASSSRRASLRRRARFIPEIVRVMCLKSGIESCAEDGMYAGTIPFVKKM